jgi:2-polyprenyl-6-methoxyphenol hydroxylase-like FAD-dependent oxidoreductase
MSNSDVVENLIIGSGLAGLATGMVLRRRQAPFEVVDVGYDSDASIKKASRSGMFERTLVPESCRRARKDGGLAQVLQRRTPARGDRPNAANNATQSRWHSQPAMVSKAGKI